MKLKDFTEALESKYTNTSTTKINESLVGIYEDYILRIFEKYHIKVAESYHDRYYPDLEQRRTVDCFVVEAIGKGFSEKFLKELRALESHDIYLDIEHEPNLSPHDIEYERKKNTRTAFVFYAMIDGELTESLNESNEKTLGELSTKDLTELIRKYRMLGGDYLSLEKSDRVEDVLTRIRKLESGKLEEDYDNLDSKILLICPDCLQAIRSRGERVLTGETVERWEIEDQGKQFKCCWCGDDYLMGDEPQDDDELIECIF